MKKGFEKLGYEVVDYNYRTIASDIGYHDMQDDFENYINNTKEGFFDLIVFCKTSGMYPPLLNHAKKIAPTWYWFMDPMSTANAMHASAYAQNATFASATSSDVTERFKSVNNNAYHIFEGYDPDIYYYEDLKKIHDVIFIGNATIPRIQEIAELRRLGINISIFGYGWPIGMKANAPVFGEDERIEINQSKIVLNLCQDSVIFSDRVIKSLGCGAMVVSQVCKDLLNSYIGEEIHFYESPENFNNIISSLLMLKRDEKLADRINENYSWEAVCRGILEKVGETQ
jgi:hypothetical protein